ASAVEWLAGEAKPPGLRWCNFWEQAATDAATQVLPDALVDVTLTQASTLQSKVTSYRMDFFASGCRCCNRTVAPPRGQRRPSAAPGRARPGAGGYNQPS